MVATASCGTLPGRQDGRSPAVRASHQTPTGWASSLDLGLPNRPARDLADANRRDATIPYHHTAGGGSAGHMCLTTTEGWTYHARNRDPTFCDVLSRVFAHTRSSLGLRDAMPSGLGRGCSRKRVEAVANLVSMSVVNHLLISTRFGAQQQGCYRRVEKYRVWDGMVTTAARDVSIQTPRGLGKPLPEHVPGITDLLPATTPIPWDLFSIVGKTSLLTAFLGSLIRARDRGTRAHRED